MTAQDVKPRIHGWVSDEAVAHLHRRPYSLDAPPSHDHLDFEPQSMVAWYHPLELARAGVKAVVSALFGSYADKREVQSVLTSAEWHDYSGVLSSQSDGLWIDYVADLGDGWDATYTVARLLAEETLAFDAGGRCQTQPRGATTVTQRGRILIMGGDQVYPTASREEYNNRTVEPYRSALPFVRYPEKAPHLYAVPGNHDWYDGLNSFFKLFCQKKWIGGWRTWQRRSYFALKLDEQLWLWGIDIQLNSNIDQPQIEYFEHLAKNVMAQHSKIILCTAEPSWVYVEERTREEKNAARKEKKKEEIYNNLGHLETKIANEHGHEVLIALAGDSHNYARYQSEDASRDGSQRQRIVSGGGGAYLHPTHHMPETLSLPKKFGGESYRRAGTFPRAPESQRLATRSLLFAFFPKNFGLTALLGGLYLLLAWIVQSVSKVTAGGTPGETLLDSFEESLDVGAFLEIIAHSPASILLIAVIVGGLIAFSGFQHAGKRLVHGGLHGLAHIALFLGLVRLFAWINLDVLRLGVDQAVQVMLFSTEMILFGGFLGGTVLGVYLWCSNRLLGIHDNEVLLCQSHPDYKNFLRLHVSREGQITLYPVGVQRVNRRWSWKLNKVERRLAAWVLMPDAGDGEAWFEPRDGNIQELARLIEGPVTIGYPTEHAGQTLRRERDVVAG